MTLRGAVSDRAFRLLLWAGGVAAATNLVANYLETGRLALVEAALQVALVFVVGLALVAYWDYVERRGDATDAENSAE